MMFVFSMRKNSFFEYFVVLGVISFLALVFLIYLSSVIVKAKEMVLQAELHNMRIALNLYRGLNGEYPQDIRELINKEIYWTQAIHEIYKRKYLEHQRVDKDGFPIDPWYRRFVYDPEAGRIFSQTRGYENW
ncbi:MAG: type II secretion system protein GspG [Candidatus Omnitrophica bacterium]|nr:type II secretion system protein GspG [Candidatus Omnitrophota bacterium]